MNDRLRTFLRSALFCIPALSIGITSVSYAAGCPFSWKYRDGPMEEWLTIPGMVSEHGGPIDINPNVQKNAAQEPLFNSGNFKVEIDEPADIKWKWENYGSYVKLFPDQDITWRIVSTSNSKYCQYTIGPGYALSQLHGHLGQSEHMMNGIAADAEYHFVGMENGSNAESCDALSGLTTLVRVVPPQYYIKDEVKGQGYIHLARNISTTQCKATDLLVDPKNPASGKPALRLAHFVNGLNINDAETTKAYVYAGALTSPADLKVGGIKIPVTFVVFEQVARLRLADFNALFRVTTLNQDNSSWGNFRSTLTCTANTGTTCNMHSAVERKPFLPSGEGSSAGGFRYAYIDGSGSRTGDPGIQEAEVSYP